MTCIRRAIRRVALKAKPMDGFGGGLSRFHCHVGHTHTAELMSLAMDENLRRALASAMRALEEHAALAHKLYDQATASGHRRCSSHTPAGLAGGLTHPWSKARKVAIKENPL